MSDHGGGSQAPTALLVALVAALTLWRLVALAATGLPLQGDEAQYWDWSQHFAFGYFSKPPMIAWAIGASTALCGDGEACIRAFSPVLHGLTSLIVFALARRLYDARVGFWSGLAYATLPGVSFSSLIASTDVALLFFWALSLLLFQRALDSERAADWVLLGVALGFGVLSKYTMALFVPCAAIYFLIAPAKRPRDFGLRAVQALAPALLIVAPNLAWNIANGFATVGHTVANANFGGKLLNPAHLGEFLGAQFGVFGPILFATLLAMIAFGRKFLAGERERLLAAFALPVLAMMTAESFISRAHANWAAVAYIGATVLVVAWLLRGRASVLWASFALHAVVALALPYQDAIAASFGGAVPRRLDLFARQRETAALGAAIKDALARVPDATPLVLDRELLASLLYYARPFSDSAVKLNLNGAIGDHYDLTRPIGGDSARSYLLIATPDAAGITSPR